MFSSRGPHYVTRVDERSPIRFQILKDVFETTLPRMRGNMEGSWCQIDTEAPQRLNYLRISHLQEQPVIYWHWKQILSGGNALEMVLCVYEYNVCEIECFLCNAEDVIWNLTHHDVLRHSVSVGTVFLDFYIRTLEARHFPDEIFRCPIAWFLYCRIWCVSGPSRESIRLELSAPAGGPRYFAAQHVRANINKGEAVRACAFPVALSTSPSRYEEAIAVPF